MTATDQQRSPAAASRWLDGCEPCTGCGGARHPTVGKAPCVVCGAVRWTLAVTGSHSLTDPHRVRVAARCALAELVDAFGCRPCLVLHGDARGVDRILAARLAQARWPVQAVPADWDTHGRKAGVLRDLCMVARADAVLAVWDGTSAGASHTIGFARQRGLRIACRIVGRHDTPDDQSDTRQSQPDRNRRHARRQASPHALGQVDAPRALMLLAAPMACQRSHRAVPTAPAVGHGPSRQTAERPLTGSEHGGSLGDTQLSASVWDLLGGRGARRVRHPARTHCATSSMLRLAWVEV